MSDIAFELAQLHLLSGAGFIQQLKYITSLGEFHPLEGEDGIYITGGEQGEDYDKQLNVARKAVIRGYKVYILPNPQGIRSADFIFERKGVYKLYDLKTIIGKNSVGNRLIESKGQTNRVLLNISSDYNPIALARSVRKYFEKNHDAVEVLIYKGRKSISINREDAMNKDFFKYFIAKYIQ